MTRFHDLQDPNGSELAVVVPDGVASGEEFEVTWQVCLIGYFEPRGHCYNHYGYCFRRYYWRKIVCNTRSRVQGDEEDALQESALDGVEDKLQISAQDDEEDALQESAHGGEGDALQDSEDGTSLQGTMAQLGAEIEGLNSELVRVSAPRCISP